MVSTYRPGTQTQTQIHTVDVRQAADSMYRLESLMEEISFEFGFQTLFMCVCAFLTSLSDVSVRVFFSVCCLLNSLPAVNVRVSVCVIC